MCIRDSYNNDTVYITDENKAPYVLDTTDNNFYVLNAQMSWKGSEQNNKTPSQDYTINKEKYWLKFDAFEAIYTKIGIIANGLIGSAVFNGDYMFSQQGINPSSSNAITTHYENFNKDHIYDGTFTPNIMFDFKTGAGHLAAGKIKFNADGSGSLGNGGLIWNANGSIQYDGFEKNIYLSDSKSENIVLPKVPLGYSKTIKIAVLWLSRTLIQIPIPTNNTDDIIVYGVEQDDGSYKTTQDKSGNLIYTPHNNGASVITLTGFGINYGNKEITMWYLEDNNIGKA